jgi:hypothetical protein
VTEDISAAPLSARGQVEGDERQLHALGYTQELRRRMGGFPTDLTIGRSR